LCAARSVSSTSTTSSHRARLPSSTVQEALEPFVWPGCENSTCVESPPSVNESEPSVSQAPGAGGGSGLAFSGSPSVKSCS
jgi:hypothetical protein